MNKKIIKNKEKKRVWPKYILLIGLVLILGLTLATVMASDTNRWYRFNTHEIINYKIGTWSPIFDITDCEECNDLDYGCSEYQCRSYGATCILDGFGTGDEFCISDNSFENRPPIMETWDILVDGFRYTPDTKVRAPDKGTIIKYDSDEGCLKPHTGLKFGVTTDQPAQCKISTERAYNYDDIEGAIMDGGPRNHSFSIPARGITSGYEQNQAGYIVEEGSLYEYYIRCINIKNIESPNHFEIKFCVDEGPDMNPPVITSEYEDGAYMTANITQVENFQIYTDESAECKWDFEDKVFDNMAYNTTYESNIPHPDGKYVFSTTLIGFNSNKMNTYYVRCKDKPDLTAEEADELGEKRYENRVSHIVNLQGTKALVIDDISLNKELIYSNEEGLVDGFLIKDSTSQISARIDVFTSQGAGREGDAKCGYMIDGSKYMFDNGQNYDYSSVNNHMWHLSEGIHNYEIECCDLADNCVDTQIEFEIKIDLDAPVVTRMYYEEESMKLITNELSECSYSLSSCNFLFDDGIKLNTIDNVNHFVKWDERESFYIKCEDKNGVGPGSNICSIIVRAQYEYEDAAILE